MKLLLYMALTLAAAAAVVAGLFAVADWLRDRPDVRERGRFSINAIDCEPPPGLTRERFLSEVHYHGQLPEQLNVLDHDLRQRLKSAFEKHPLVERVDDVKVSPPNHVRIKLVYRKGD